MNPSVSFVSLCFGYVLSYHVLYDLASRVWAAKVERRSTVVGRMFARETSAERS